MVQLYNKKIYNKPLISFLMILVFFNNFNNTNAVIDDVLDVLHVTKVVATGILKTWDIIEETKVGEHVELPVMREKSKKVLKRIAELSRKIDQNQEKFSIFAEYTIEQINDRIKTNTRLELELHEIKDIINRIGSRANEMERYEKHQDTLEPDTLIKFAEWNVSPNAYAINHLLERLHVLFIGAKRESRTSNRNVLMMLSDSLLDARDQICVTNQSAQQFLYSLYSDVAYAELKGYTMMQFSWMMLRIYEKGNFTEESNLMRNEFIKRIDRTQDALRGVIKHADRSVWKCDPTKHLKGQTYDEVTRLLQGYIENEVDMNEDGTCRENCAYYQVSKSHGCYQDLYCAKQQRCTGKLYNCQYVDSDMWICPSALNSSRRYDYIEYENGRVLGEKSGSCVRGTSKVDSWWRWLFWHCSYCFCLCDEQGLKSDRYFNLRSTESDIHKNMVVTGLRFVKVKRIFHLQVQQGELLPRGNIKQESLEWKPVDDYQIFDRNVKSKVDYHTLAWENRAIDLDDINVVDPTHVITGIRFRVVGTHLNLEAKLSEYNFETGLLVEPEINSFWQSNDNTDVTGDKRTQVILRSPDIPIRSIARSQVKSKHNQYIEFTNTDMDKDAAQTTVPFIDIQEVTSSPPVPLSGVGIYYKGSGQYGGFIAPKLITYDFTPHIQSPFKAEERSRMI
ncbi:uncharacterized protein LOC129605506 isoform X1 [Condylostylus longicornis]|uniref:uncharacterized protein LOC129605506 isoform X1 n=1 Tax=Condylostylus longicornis TaxID=2530218 RepID=UPI00244DCCF4|nr:uncharacterized protein LOC129605506 isoform X1 [Condylostylus longicornis]